MRSPSEPEREPDAGDRCHVLIRDQEDTPQRFPLRRLLEAVRNVVAPEQQSWRVSGVWGQGLKTVRLQNELRERGEYGEIFVSTADLLDLDSDPDEWFFDVTIKTSDRTLAFGIFDSGYMFVDGRRAQVIEIGKAFDDVPKMTRTPCRRRSAAWCSPCVPQASRSGDPTMPTGVIRARWPSQRDVA